MLTTIIQVIVAIYVRYSDALQSPTSLEDQTRRCKEFAAKHGFCVDDVLIFSDKEISGKDASVEKRAGYRALKEAWAAHRFQVLIVDELSRLARGPKEQGALQALLDADRRMRLMTVDGIDSYAPGWQFRFGMQGMMSQEELRRLKHRVPRGMQGQLERGHMVATPAYGYKLKRHYDEKGNRIATDWEIDPERSDIVRECYKRRVAGQTYRKIAEWLNSEDVPIARDARTPEGGFWRPSRVQTILANPIYRGTFVWHDSTTYHSRMEKEGGDVEPVEYARPQLRLVSDELWNQCREKSHSRTGYGGGRYALSGLITCGYCQRTLAVSAPKKRRDPSLYCPACAIAKAVNGKHEGLTRTINAKAIYAVLEQALQLCLAPAFIDEFHQALARKLGGDNLHEIEECRQRLGKLRSSQERFSRMLGAVTEDDPVLEQRYHEAHHKVVETEKRLVALEAGRVEVDASIVAIQRKANPAKALKGLFASETPPEKLRAVLARLFPKIVFEGKLPPSPGQRLSRTSIFRVHFAPGVALSLATETTQVLDNEVVCRMQVEYIPAISSKTRKDKRQPRPMSWDVKLLGTTVDGQVRAPLKSKTA